LILLIATTKYTSILGYYLYYCNIKSSVKITLQRITTTKYTRHVRCDLWIVNSLIIIKKIGIVSINSTSDSTDTSRVRVYQCQGVLGVTLVHLKVSVSHTCTLNTSFKIKLNFFFTNYNLFMYF